MYPWKGEILMKNSQICGIKLSKKVKINQENSILAVSC